MSLANVSCTKVINLNFLFKSFSINLPDDLRICMSKFRMCNHKLPIELRRYNNIERNLRKYNKCGIDIGDEYHYLFICDYFKYERSMFIQGSYYKKPNYHNYNVPVVRRKVYYDTLILLL